MIVVGFVYLFEVVFEGGAQLLFLLCFYID
jgi:hypothetical protein